MKDKAMVNEQVACAVNIGSKERQKRLISGIMMLTLSVGILVALVATDVNRWWRLALFLPLWMGMVGFFQAKERT